MVEYRVTDFYTKFDKTFGTFSDAMVCIYQLLCIDTQQKCGIKFYKTDENTKQVVFVRKYKKSYTLIFTKNDGTSLKDAIEFSSLNFLYPELEPHYEKLMEKIKEHNIN